MTGGMSPARPGRAGPREPAGGERDTPLTPRAFRRLIPGREA